MRGYISVTEAAKRAGVSRNSIYLAVRTGRLEHKIILGHVAVSEAAVEAYTPLPPSARKGMKTGPNKTKNTVLKKAKE